ncbi:MAG: DUF6340 family protein [Saprospiraceae bacterium]|nr:DUF6340 family protein [Saprospiraceae bacterium]
MKYIIIAFTSMVFASCAVHETYVSTTRPPDIQLDQNIVRIALVDRSEPSNKAANVLEGLVTGEHIGQDAEGRKVVFSSLRDIMRDQERFELIDSGIELEGSKSGAKMEDPLRRKWITDVAEKYEADAVLVLESFDSDTRNLVSDALDWHLVRIAGAGPVSYPNNLRTSWRLYGGKDGEIIDEFYTFITQEGWWAFTDQSAFVDRQYVLSAADASAFQMAGRIIPLEVYLERSYYKSAGHKARDMQKAHRFVKAERMERAGEIWRDIYHSDASRKAKGRAAYNMALYYEYKGDLRSALQWIEESISKGNRRAIEYAAILTDRLQRSR